jgi:hypothetical protein
VHCWHACAATRRATAPILLSYRWPSTYSRVAGCLARAHACGNEPSRPSVEHSRSHPRTRQSNSTRTSAFALPPFLPARRAITAPSPPRGPRPACIRITPSAVVHTRPPPFSTSSSQCCLTSSAASSSTVSDVLHAWLYCPRADPPVAATLQLRPHRV